MKICIFILLTVFIAVGCDKEKDSVNPNINNYPLTVGAKWTYDEQIILTRYESASSETILDVDTILRTQVVSIEKDTVLNDTMHVFVFKTQEIGSAWATKEYKFMDTDGLKIYAYSFVNGFEKSFNRFNSLFYEGLINIRKRNDDIISVENKPLLEYKLPMELNSTWIYRYSNEELTLQINKKVVGAENVSALEQNFPCFKVAWEYVYDSLYSGIKVTEWISDKGLVKKHIIIDRLEITDPDGIPIEGSYQISTTFLLKEL